MKWIRREVKSRWWAYALYLILIWGGTFVPELGVEFNIVSTVLLVVPSFRYWTRIDDNDVLVLYEKDTKKDANGGQIPEASSTDSGDDE